jgi:hypothetical protein
MAPEDPKSTIIVDSDTSGARTGIKSLTDLIGGFFSSVRSGSEQGGPALGTFTNFWGKLFATISSGAVVANIASAGILGIVNSIGAAAKSVFGFIGSSIAMNAQLESTTLQFETLMGSADAAQRHVAFLFEFAKKTPFETGPVIEASKQFQVFGGSALNTQKNLLLVGDAAAATNKPIQEIGMWTGRLYASLQAGKPFGEAAQRLSELAVLTPKARMEMEAMQKAGKSGQEIFQRYQEELGRFNGAMEKQAGTWGGLTSTMKDTLSILSATAFAPFFDMAKTGLKTIVDLLGSEGITNAAKGVGQAFGDAFGIAKATIGPVISALFQANVATINARDGTAAYESIVRGTIKTLALFVDTLAWISRAVAIVISAYYEFRIAGNLLLVSFGKVVEGILVGTKAIADGMAKVSFGETRKSFERDSLALAEKLAIVRKDIGGLQGDTEQYRKTSEATGASLRGFADKLNVASAQMREKAAAYKYTAPAVKVYSDAVSEATEMESAGTKGTNALGKSKESLQKKIAALSATLREGERNGVDFNKMIERNGTQIKSVVEEAEIYGLKVPENLRKAYQAAIEADASKKMNELAEKLAKARLAGADLTTIIEQFGSEMKRAVLEADAFGREVPEDIRAVRQAMIDAELDKAYQKTMGEIVEINRAEWTKIADETEKSVKDAGKAYDGMKDVVTKAADDALLATKTGLQKQLAELDIKQRDEIRKLGTMPAAYGNTYDQALKNVEKKYAEMETSREEKQRKEIAELDKIGPTYGVKYEAAKTKVIEKYALMAAHAEKRRIEEIAGLGPIPEEYRKTYDAAVAAINKSFAGIKTEEIKKDAKEIRKEYIEGLDAIAKSLSDLANIAPGEFGRIAGAAASVVGAFATIEKSIDSVKGGLSLLSGGAEGGLNFANIASGIGSLIGGIGGIVTAATVGWTALKALFGGKEEWKKIADASTAEYGFAMSEGLAKQIAAIAKTIEGGTKNQRREIAEALSLSKIIAEGGGLNEGNISRYTNKATELLNIIAAGGKNSAQAQTEFNSVFKQFGDYLIQNGKIADEHFLKLIANAKATGVEIQAVNDFILSQSKTVIAGLKAFTDNATVTTQAGATALAGAAVLMFDEIKKATGSAKEAAAQMGPVVAALEKQFQAAGFTGGAAFDIIKSRIATASDEIVSKGLSAIGGLAQTLVGLNNIGQLTPDIFSGIAGEIANVHAKLIAQGKSSEDVMALMASDLQKVWELKRRHGYAVDEVTQKLLDEAEATGAVGAQHMSAADRMAESTLRVANAIEFMAKQMGFVPPAADAMAAGVGAAGARIEQTLKEKVGGALDLVKDKTEKHDWQKWADRGIAAGLGLKSGLDLVKSGLGGISDKTAESAHDFDQWAAQASEDIARVKAEADALTFGTSPGGLKEWAPMVRQSMAMFGAFGAQSVQEIRKVKREVDSFTAPKLAGLGISASAAHSTTDNARGIINANKHEWHLAVPVTVHAQSFDPLTLLEMTDDVIGPRVAEGIRLNINDMFTRFMAAQAATKPEG